MASIEDRWFSGRPGPDGKKARKPRHGTGKRWKVHYTDPDGRQRGESFDRRSTLPVQGDRRGRHPARRLIDPDAGADTSEVRGDWLAAQTFGDSTRERTDPAAAAYLPDIGGCKARSYRSASWPAVAEHHPGMASRPAGHPAPSPPALVLKTSPRS